MSELDSLALERLAGGVRGELILEDRPCGECGYNVKGLQIGGKCPECGTPILSRRRSKEPPMGDSPPLYLQGLALGLLMMSGLGLVWPLWFIMVGRASVSVGIGLLLTLAIYGGWFGGVLLVARERPFAQAKRQSNDTPPEWWRLRLAIVITQGMGFVGALAVVLGGGAVGGIVLLVSLVVVMGGWAPLCVLLSRLAYWAPDDQVAQRFMALAWWMPILGGITALAVVAPGVGVLRFLDLVGLWCFLAYIVLAGIMVFQVLRLSSTVRWAGKNAAHARARDRRMAERAARRAEEHRVEVDNLAPIPSADEALLAEIERKHEAMAEEESEAWARGDRPKPGSHHQHTIKPQDAEAFELEDEPEDRPASS